MCPLRYFPDSGHSFPERSHATRGETQLDLSLSLPLCASVVLFVLGREQLITAASCCCEHSRQRSQQYRGFPEAPSSSLPELGPPPGANPGSPEAPSPPTMAALFLPLPLPPECPHRPVLAHVTCFLSSMPLFTSHGSPGRKPMSPGRRSQLPPDGLYLESSSPVVHHLHSA